MIFNIGIICFASAVLFQAITLPVEYNASNRAIKQMNDLGIIYHEESASAKSSFCSSTDLCSSFGDNYCNSSENVSAEGASVRWIKIRAAFHALFDVESRKSFSNIALNHNIKRIRPDSPAFVRELVYGVLENKIYLDYIIKSFERTN